jgi:hypothetical protein
MFRYVQSAGGWLAFEYNMQGAKRIPFYYLRLHASVHPPTIHLWFLLGSSLGVLFLFRHYYHGKLGVLHNKIAAAQNCTSHVQEHGD